jgi:hypothetical protein
MSLGKAENALKDLIFQILRSADQTFVDQKAFRRSEIQILRSEDQTSKCQKTF